MKEKKSSQDISFIFLLGLIIVFAIAIVVCITIINRNRASSPNHPVGSDPITFTSPIDNDSSADNNIVVRNIEIEDFDEWGMGLLSSDKYYQIQYGVHIKDGSFKGPQIGTTSSENKLTHVKDDVYQYSESASYFIDDNSAYFKFNGEEDVVLLDTGDVDQTINGMWVLSPEILPKASLYDFIENPAGVELVYYPSIEDTSHCYTIEAAEDFIKSFKRVSTPRANSVELGYLTFDDNSGLLYGMLVYYDYDTGECYLSPPSYPKLFFKANAQLGQYLSKYYLSSYNVDEPT